jgi:hypothetical protein
MVRWMLLGLLVMSGVAMASDSLTQDSWTKAIQKKVPPNGTLFGTGKFKMLCQCSDIGDPLLFQRTGAIEQLTEPDGTQLSICSVPIFNASGNLTETSGCFIFTPLTKP